MELVNDRHASTRSPVRPSWQFGILSILLVTAAFATWFHWYRLKTESDFYAEQIPVMRFAARELDVKDPEQYALAKQESDWNDEESWLVYLPEGQQYKLMGEATVFRGEKMELEDFEVPIEPGQHKIDFSYKDAAQDKINLRVGLNGEEVFLLVGERLTQFSTGSNPKGDNYQLSLDEFLELKRDVWMSVDKPGKFKKVFDARDQEKKYYKSRVYIRTVE